MPDVSVGVPVLNDRVSPLFDTATRLLLIKRHDGREIARREIVLGILSSDALARTLADLQVEQVLCAAVSSELLRALHHEGIRVRSHLCGPVDSILEAFAHGRLHDGQFRMPGCWGQDYHRKQPLRRPRR